MPETTASRAMVRCKKQNGDQSPGPGGISVHPAGQIPEPLVGGAESAAALGSDEGTGAQPGRRV